MFIYSWLYWHTTETLNSLFAAQFMASLIGWQRLFSENGLCTPNSRGKSIYKFITSVWVAKTDFFLFSWANRVNYYYNLTVRLCFRAVSSSLPASIILLLTYHLPSHSSPAAPFHSSSRILSLFSVLSLCPLWHCDNLCQSVIIDLSLITSLSVNGSSAQAEWYCSSRFTAKNRLTGGRSSL